MFQWREYKLGGRLMIVFLVCLPNGKRVQATPLRPSGISIDYEKKTWSPRRSWPHESRNAYQIGTARPLIQGQDLSNELIGVFEMDDPEQINILVGAAQDVATLNL